MKTAGAVHHRLVRGLRHLGIKMKLKMKIRYYWYIGVAHMTGTARRYIKVRIGGKQRLFDTWAPNGHDRPYP